MQHKAENKGLSFVRPRCLGRVRNTWHVRRVRRCQAHAWILGILHFVILFKRPLDECAISEYLPEKRSQLSTR